MSDIIDEYGVPEFFCEKLHSIRPAGPCRRLVFTINAGGSGVSIGVAKLVLPAEVLAEIAQMLAAECQTQSCVLDAFPISARAAN